MSGEEDPIIVKGPIFNALRHVALQLSPRNRKVALVFDVYNYSEVQEDCNPRPPDTASPTYILIADIRFLFINLHQFLGNVTYYESTKKKSVSNAIKGFIDDLFKMNFEVVISLSSAKEEVMQLLESLPLVRTPEGTLEYRVGALYNIVHIFDPNWLSRELCVQFKAHDVTFTDELGCRHVSYNDIREANLDTASNNMTTSLEMFFSRQAAVKVKNELERKHCFNEAAATSIFLNFIHKMRESLKSNSKEQLTAQRFKYQQKFWIECVRFLETMDFLMLHTPTENWFIIDQTDNQRDPNNVNSSHEAISIVTSNSNKCLVCKNFYLHSVSVESEEKGKDTKNQYYCSNKSQEVCLKTKEGNRVALDKKSDKNQMFRSEQIKKISVCSPGETQEFPSEESQIFSQDDNQKLPPYEKELTFEENTDPIINMEIRKLAKSISDKLLTSDAFCSDEEENTIDQSVKNLEPNSSIKPSEDIFKSLSSYHTLFYKNKELFAVNCNDKANLQNSEAGKRNQSEDINNLRGAVKTFFKFLRLIDSEPYQNSILKLTEEEQKKYFEHILDEIGNSFGMTVNTNLKDEIRTSKLTSQSYSDEGSGILIEENNQNECLKIATTNSTGTKNQGKQEVAEDANDSESNLNPKHKETLNGSHYQKHVDKEPVSLAKDIMVPKINNDFKQKKPKKHKKEQKGEGLKNGLKNDKTNTCEAIHHLKKDEDAKKNMKSINEEKENHETKVKTRQSKNISAQKIDFEILKSTNTMDNKETPKDASTDSNILKECESLKPCSQDKSVLLENQSIENLNKFESFKMIMSILGEKSKLRSNNEASELKTNPLEIQKSDNTPDIESETMSNANSELKRPKEIEEKNRSLNETVLRGNFVSNKPKEGILKIEDENKCKDQKVLLQSNDSSKAKNEDFKSIISKQENNHCENVKISKKNVSESAGSNVKTQHKEMVNLLIPDISKSTEILDLIVLETVQDKIPELYGITNEKRVEIQLKLSNSSFILKMNSFLSLALNMFAPIGSNGIYIVEESAKVQLEYKYARLCKIFQIKKKLEEAGIVNKSGDLNPFSQKQSTTVLFDYKMFINIASKLQLEIDEIKYIDDEKINNLEQKCDDDVQPSTSKYKYKKKGKNKYHSKSKSKKSNKKKYRVKFSDETLMKDSIDRDYMEMEKEFRRSINEEACGFNNEYFKSKIELKCKNGDTENTNSVDNLQETNLHCLNEKDQQNSSLTLQKKIQEAVNANKKVLQRGMSNTLIANGDGKTEDFKGCILNPDQIIGNHSDLFSYPDYITEDEKMEFEPGPVVKVLPLPAQECEVLDYIETPLTNEKVSGDNEIPDISEVRKYVANMERLNKSMSELEIEPLKPDSDILKKETLPRSQTVKREDEKEDSGKIKNITQYTEITNQNNNSFKSIDMNENSKDKSDMCKINEAKLISLGFQDHEVATILKADHLLRTYDAQRKLSKSFDSKPDCNLQLNSKSYKTTNIEPLVKTKIVTNSSVNFEKSEDSILNPQEVTSKNSLAKLNSKLKTGNQVANLATIKEKKSKVTADGKAPTTNTNHQEKEVFKSQVSSDLSKEEMIKEVKSIHQYLIERVNDLAETNFNACSEVVNLTSPFKFDKEVDNIDTQNQDNILNVNEQTKCSISLSSTEKTEKNGDSTLHPNRNLKDGKKSLKCSNQNPQNIAQLEIKKPKNSEPSKQKITSTSKKITMEKQSNLKAVVDNNANPTTSSKNVKPSLINENFSSGENIESTCNLSTTFSHQNLQSLLKTRKKNTKVNAHCFRNLAGTEMSLIITPSAMKLLEQGAAPSAIYIPSIKETDNNKEKILATNIGKQEQDKVSSGSNSINKTSSKSSNKKTNKVKKIVRNDTIEKTNTKKHSSITKLEGNDQLSLDVSKQTGASEVEQRTKENIFPLSNPKNHSIPSKSFEETKVVEVSQSLRIEKTGAISNEETPNYERNEILVNANVDESLTKGHSPKVEEELPEICINGQTGDSKKRRKRRNKRNASKSLEETTINKASQVDETTNQGESMSLSKTNCNIKASQVDETTNQGESMSMSKTNCDIKVSQVDETTKQGESMSLSKPNCDIKALQVEETTNQGESMSLSKTNCDNDYFKDKNISISSSAKQKVKKKSIVIAKSSEGPSDNLAQVLPVKFLPKCETKKSSLNAQLEITSRLEEDDKKVSISKALEDTLDTQTSVSNVSLPNKKEVLTPLLTNQTEIKSTTTSKHEDVMTTSITNIKDRISSKNEESKSNKPETDIFEDKSTLVTPARKETNLPNKKRKKIKFRPLYLDEIEEMERQAPISPEKSKSRNRETNVPFSWHQRLQKNTMVSVNKTDSSDKPIKINQLDGVVDDNDEAESIKSKASQKKKKQNKIKNRTQQKDDEIAAADSNSAALVSASILHKSKKDPLTQEGSIKKGQQIAVTSKSSTKSDKILSTNKGTDYDRSDDSEDIYVLKKGSIEKQKKIYSKAKPKKIGAYSEALACCPNDGCDKLQSSKNHVINNNPVIVSASILYEDGESSIIKHSEGRIEKTSEVGINDKSKFPDLNSTNVIKESKEKRTNIKSKLNKMDAIIKENVTVMLKDVKVDENKVIPESNPKLDMINKSIKNDERISLEENGEEDLIKKKPSNESTVIDNEVTNENSKCTTNEEIIKKSITNNNASESCKKDESICNGRSTSISKKSKKKKKKGVRSDVPNQGNEMKKNSGNVLEEDVVKQKTISDRSPEREHDDGGVANKYADHSKTSLSEGNEHKENEAILKKDNNKKFEKENDTMNESCKVKERVVDDLRDYEKERGSIHGNYYGLDVEDVIKKNLTDINGIPSAKENRSPTRNTKNLINESVNLSKLNEKVKRTTTSKKDEIKSSHPIKKVKDLNDQAACSEVEKVPSPFNLVKEGDNIDQDVCMDNLKNKHSINNNTSYVNDQTTNSTPISSNVKADINNDDSTLLTNSYFKKGNLSINNEELKKTFLINDENAVTPTQCPPVRKIIHPYGRKERLLKTRDEITFEKTRCKSTTDVGLENKQQPLVANAKKNKAEFKNISGETSSSNVEVICGKEETLSGIHKTQIDTKNTASPVISLITDKGNVKNTNKAKPEKYFKEKNANENKSIVESEQKVFAFGSSFIGSQIMMDVMKDIKFEQRFPRKIEERIDVGNYRSDMKCVFGRPTPRSINSETVEKNGQVSNICLEKENCIKNFDKNVFMTSEEKTTDAVRICRRIMDKSLEKNFTETTVNEKGTRCMLNNNVNISSSTKEVVNINNNNPNMKVIRQTDVKEIMKNKSLFAKIKESDNNLDKDIITTICLSPGIEGTSKISETNLSSVANDEKKNDQIVAKKRRKRGKKSKIPKTQTDAENTFKTVGETSENTILTVVSESSKTTTPDEGSDNVEFDESPTDIKSLQFENLKEGKFKESTKHSEISNNLASDITVKTIPNKKCVLAKISDCEPFEGNAMNDVSKIKHVGVIKLHPKIQKEITGTKLIRSAKKQRASRRMSVFKWLIPETKRPTELRLEKLFSYVYSEDWHMKDEFFRFQEFLSNLTEIIWIMSNKMPFPQHNKLLDYLSIIKSEAKKWSRETYYKHTALKISSRDEMNSVYNLLLPFINKLKQCNIENYIDDSTVINLTSVIKGLLHDEEIVFDSNTDIFHKWSFTLNGLRQVMKTHAPDGQMLTGNLTCNDISDLVFRVQVLNQKLAIKMVPTQEMDCIDNNLNTFAITENGNITLRW